MSDTFISLVPVEPGFVPEPARIRDAELLACKLFPRSDEIRSAVTDHIRLFDAGANFEAIECPGCHAAIGIEWWHDALSADTTGEGFALRPFAVPCCGRSCSLDQLKYDWPQAFGRFGLRLMNPDAGTLDPAAIESLQEVLGTKLRIIHQHL
jgi:hypothetical protein